MTDLLLALAGPWDTLEEAVEATVQAVSLSTGASDSGGLQYGCEVAWGLIYGQLRGRIPYPVPFDLVAVAVSVAVRWSQYLANSETVRVQGSEVLGGSQPQFTGFTLSELVVLWRYRVRTA